MKRVQNEAADAQSSNVLETNFGNEEKVEYVAYSSLCKSPLNVRKKAPTDIEGLADSIAAKGLMQNLVVHSINGGRAKRAKFGVCGGQRRLAAFDLLFARGKIKKGHPVAVKIVSEAEALAASLLENQHEPMCPADQCEAFKMLVEEGRSAEYVAALFSVSPQVVQRRLKLANAAPRLLNLFRNDEISIEQIKALALADDHELQERVWAEAVQPWQREPRELRAAITQTEIDASRSHLARFVGIDAYEAAGGYVRKDLFSDTDNAGFIADADLLHRLATDKLIAASQAVSVEGWSWTEVRAKRDYSEMMRFGRLQSFTRDLTVQEQAVFDALVAKRDEASAKLDACYASDDEAEEGERLEEEANATSEAVDAYAERFEAFNPEDMKQAGAFIVVGNDGELMVERGLVRPDDTAKLTGNEESSDATFGVGASRALKEKPLHGEKLCRRLTAHRTAAVQIELSRHPTIALAAMMNRLIPVVFREHYLCSYAEHEVKIDAHTSRDKLLSEADDMESSVAWQELEAERAKWIAMLPKNVNAVLPWLLEQEAELTANLFAFCVAATVDGISAADRAHPINALVDLMQVDMPYYWTPTRESYFDHISKARIVDVVLEAVSPEAAADLQSMKKGDAATAAELRLKEKGWLPEVLMNRETPTVYSYGMDDDEEANDEADDAEARDES